VQWEQEMERRYRKSSKVCWEGAAKHARETIRCPEMFIEKAGDVTARIEEMKDPVTGAAELVLLD
jgi:hypothetical protein